MATRLKTIEYWFPHLATAADNVSTPFAQITATVPESSVTFRRVVFDVIVPDSNTAITNVTARNVSLTIQGASASTVNNTTTLTQSGEQFALFHSVDFTSYFVSNWGANTSRTIDASITVNTGALGCRNISARLTITYEYDDTSATQVKTAWIPLDAPRVALPTTKPGSANAGTIPALDTYLPEGAKTVLQTAIVMQGNTEGNGTLDKTVSVEVGALGALTSELYECGSNADIWYRLVHVTTFDTSLEHDVFVWSATGTDFDHPQLWLAVTYTFEPASTTRAIQSLWLPVEFGGVMGGPTSSDYQRATRELWIQEPGTITLERLACFVHYDKLAAQTGLNARIGTGSFLSYTCVSTVLCGGAGFMIRNDGAFTLARGRNTISVDVFNTDASDLGFNLSCCFLVNYTSDVHADGISAHNHTVRWPLRTIGSAGASVQTIVASTSPSVPETSFFYTAIGLHYVYTSNAGNNPTGVHVGAERTVAEGGLVWENVYESLGGSDPEVGVRQAWASARSVFRRWPGDVGDGRLALQQDRRWRIALGGRAASFDHLDLVFTYHSITFMVAGDVTGSGGGTVELSLHRADSGERVLTTSRVGNGAFSFTWYDDTEAVYVDAYEDATHLGRSAEGTAA